jgi:DNA modification methylase
MIRVLHGDCRAILPTLPAASVHCVVTSPPYWGLRDYGVSGQLGLEPDFNAYVAAMVGVFREVRRVLRDDGTLWLNLGDSYNSNQARAGMSVGDSYRGSDTPTLNREHQTRVHFNGIKPKDLCGIPWRVAFALQADGWYLRQDIIWSKPNPMPESVTDRCTKAHEYLFLLSKRERYYYDQDAIREPHLETSIARALRPWNGNAVRGDPLGRSQLVSNGRDAGAPMDTCHPHGRNKRSVWEVTTRPFSEAHFATFPPALIEPCIKAGCPKDGTVLDPFGGAGTTGLVADRLQRNAILVELNPAYATMAGDRITGDAPLFAVVSN